MIFKWESEKERRLRFISVTPKKKLEWLRQMQSFLAKAMTKKQRHIYHKLRESR